MVAIVSPGGPNLYSLSTPPDELLAATAAGVFLLGREAGAQEWRVKRRSLEQHHIHALLFEPGSGLLFAGIHNGTVQMSRDLGLTWEASDRGINEANIYTLNRAEHRGSTRLFAGTEPAHLYFSDDLGKSWQELPALRDVPSCPTWDYPQPPHVAHVKQVVADPHDARTIYVCIEQGALLRSRDDGTSWEELNGFYRDVHRLAILPSDSRKMFLACGDGVYFTADRAATWQRLTDRSTKIGYPDGLVVHPQSENLVFISGAGTIPPTWSKFGTAGTCVGRSRDGGSSWQFSRSGFPVDFTGNIEALSMVVWPNSYCLIAGTTEGDILLSEDEGASWAAIATGLPSIAKRRHHLYLKPARAASV